MFNTRLAARASCSIFLALLTACGGGDPPGDRNPGLPDLLTITPEHTGDGWQVSTPGAEQMDGAQLMATLQSIRGSTPGVDSMVVVRNGRLVAEGYFNGFGRESLHDLRSTGKSFTSALAGIAQAQNLLTPADLLSAHIPNFAGYDHMDSRKQGITLLNLLNMNSGLECNDWNASSPGQEEKMYDKQDWVKFILDLPMAADPGAVSQYCTGGVVVLGHVISLSSGMPLDSYANTWLFGPLGIRDATWRRSPDGRATGGGGLRLRPRDAAKLGALYANEGLWNGQRIIPETWVMLSRQRVTTLGQDGYGYNWWKRGFTRNGAPLECFFTSGNGGNFVFVFPALELVVTFTGSNYNSEKMDYPFRLLPSVLAAVQ